MGIIKLKIFPVPVRLHSGFSKMIFVIISPFFAISKNVVHSLEPVETPTYSASQLGSKLCTAFLNISKPFLKWLRFGCGYFFNLLLFSTVHVNCFLRNLTTLYLLTHLNPQNQDIIYINLTSAKDLNCK